MAAVPIARVSNAHKTFVKDPQREFLRPDSVPERERVALYGLVQRVRASCYLKLERLQAQVDGAVLAAEQIQDKRIELLEKGPEVTIDDVIWDALLGLAFSGVGKALAPIGKSICKELAAGATYYGSMSNNPRFSAALGVVVRQAVASKLEGLGPAPKIGAKEIGQYNELIREFLAEGIATGGEAAGELAKNAAEAYEKPKTKKVKLESTDSIGVALLGAAQTYVSQQRYAQQLFHSGIEMYILGGSPTDAELAKIEPMLMVEAPETPLVEIRDRHKLLYEALMWIRIFKLGGPLRKRKNSGGEFDLGVQPPLQRYFRHRFARSILLWLQSVARDAYSIDTVKSKGIDLRPYGQIASDTGAEKDKFLPFSPEQFMKLDTAVQDNAVNLFFRAVSQDFDEVLNAQGTAEGSDGFQLIVDPVVKSSP